MNEILHANIFFFITSVAVVVFTLLVCITLYQVIKILRTTRRIVDRIEAGSEVIAEDVTHFRRYVREGGLISQIVGVFLRRHEKRSSSRRKKEDDDITNEDE